MAGFEPWPEEFEVEFKTRDGPYLAVKLQGHRLRVQRSFYGSPAAVSPLGDCWSAFWEKLDQLDVWSWCSTYDNPTVLDGFAWRVRIAHAGRSLESRGSNGYPGQALDDPDPSPEFRAFQAAVDGLLASRASGTR